MQVCCFMFDNENEKQKQLVRNELKNSSNSYTSAQDPKLYIQPVRNAITYHTTEVCVYIYIYAHNKDK